MKIPQSFLTAGAKSKDRPKYGHSHTSGMSGIDSALSTKLVSSSRAITAQPVDIEKDDSLVQRLDFPTWLPFAAKTYKISPRIEDFIVVPTIICPSDIPNRNGIAFPLNELVAFQPPPIARQAYKAWTGCPVHLEHDNEDHEKAYGVILDASLHKVLGYGGGKLWKVMGLLAIDKNKYPDIAQQVLDKIINTYSMGAMVNSFTCSYCGTECDDKYCCPHIQSTKVVNWNRVRNYDGQDHISFLNAHSLSPIECSIVRDPAWAPALSDEVWDPWGDGPTEKQEASGNQNPFTDSDAQNLATPGKSHAQT